MKRIDKNDPCFVPYIKGYGMIDENYHFDWMDCGWEDFNIECKNCSQRIMKDFKPVPQNNWYDENKLKYPYKVNES